jgi:transcriptional regulator with XRE-family HTH domain
MFLSVKEVRMQLGITQDAMAKLLGITRNYLALMETNKRNTPNEVLEKANKLVDTVPENQSVTEWKTRALVAEAKLGQLRAAIRNFNKVVENLEGAL